MIEEFRGKLVDETTGPNIARLMASGFDPRFKVERLEQPIVSDEAIFEARCDLLLIPRAKAARQCKPAGGRVLSNVSVELFAQEAEHGETTLRDLYAEKCAAVAIDMIDREAPGVLVGGT